MTVVRAQVTFPTTAPEEQDVVMNTFYFNVISVEDSILAGTSAALQQFYSQIQTVYPVGVLLSQGFATYYDMSQPKPRPPVAQHLLGITQTGVGTGGPPEVSMVMSFHGSRIAGMPQARRRGRIYIGPLDYGLLQGTKPNPSLITQIKGAGQLLLDLSQNNTWDWVVWSETQLEKPVGTHLPWTLVEGGWVDDAWDTTRRRELAPTTKTVFGTPQDQNFTLELPGGILSRGAPSD